MAIFPRGSGDADFDRNDPVTLRLPMFRDVELSIKTMARLVSSRHRFDVTHAQQVHWQSLATLLVARVLGKPSVLTLHVKVPSGRGWILRRASVLLERLAIAYANAVVAVSSPVAESFRLPKARIIENGVDVRTFRPTAEGRRKVRTSLGLGAETTFLFVGRWTETKGLDVLIRASDSVALTHRPFKIVILGEPTTDDPTYLEREIQKLNHPSHMLVAGSIREGLPDYFSAGDVFVSPSLYEGMPLAFLEAMATGLPPLASDIPIHRLLINRAGVGWLFPSGDSERLAAIMAEIIDQGVPTSWPERAREMAVRDYEVRSKVAQYVALYETIVGGQAEPSL